MSVGTDRCALDEALVEAVRAEDAVRVRDLLARGANPDATARDGRPVLNLAATQGAVAIVQPLLDAGASVRSRAEPWATPLHCAAGNGHLEVVRALLAAGAPTEEHPDAPYNTPLHWAAAGGHQAAVRVLLAAGARINATNDRGWTPLYWAAANDMDNVVRLLLAAGADMDLRTTEGLTAEDVATPALKSFMQAFRATQAVRERLAAAARVQP